MPLTNCKIKQKIQQPEIIAAIKIQQQQNTAVVKMERWKQKKNIINNTREPDLIATEMLVLPLNSFRNQNDSDSNPKHEKTTPI